MTRRTGREITKERQAAAAGQDLEELHPGRVDDVVELIAYHYGRSAEGEKAVGYAIRSADRRTS